METGSRNGEEVALTLKPRWIGDVLARGLINTAPLCHLKTTGIKLVLSGVNFFPKTIPWLKEWSKTKTTPSRNL